MKILFQGDSITDVGRDKENHTTFGEGYPLLVKAALGLEEPVKHEFFNRGVSGHRIVDIYSRIKKDIINLKPDVMSLLIGVNDVWHEIGGQNGVDADKYYKIYAMLVEEIKAALPDIKIIVLEPFVLQGTATKEHWDYFDVEVKKRAQMAKKIAQTYGLAFVPLQEGFDALSEKASAEYWLKDGVHPTAMGHEYIKTQWLHTFKNL